MGKTLKHWTHDWNLPDCSPISVGSVTSVFHRTYVEPVSALRPIFGTNCCVATPGGGQPNFGTLFANICLVNSHTCSQTHLKTCEHIGCYSTPCLPRCYATQRFHHNKRPWCRETPMAFWSPACWRTWCRSTSSHRSKPSQSRLNVAGWF